MSLLPLTPAAISSSAISPISNERLIINKMEETQVHNYGRKLMNPKHSMSFNQRITTNAKHSKDVTKVIREKFNESKRYVNDDLAKFTHDLVDLVEKTKESNPEWRETLEKLLRVADECTKMTVEEFWFECTTIVEELDNRRRELEIGTLKRAHTSLLFILTRCTRLVQFLKEDNDQNQQFWFLNAQNFRAM